MSGQRSVTVHITAGVRSFVRGMGHAAFNVRMMAWDLRHAPVTDVERLAFRWALAHIRAGRIDLAVEDLAWLGARS